MDELDVSTSGPDSYVRITKRDQKSWKSETVTQYVVEVSGGRRLIMSPERPTRFPDLNLEQVKEIAREQFAGFDYSLELVRPFSRSK